MEVTRGTHVACKEPACFHSNFKLQQQSLILIIIVASTRHFYNLSARMKTSSLGPFVDLSLKLSFFVHGPS